MKIPLVHIQIKDRISYYLAWAVIGHFPSTFNAKQWQMIVMFAEKNVIKGCPST